MTQTTPERKPCSVCPGEYVVTANGTIRHHFTDNPEFQAGPDSRKCRGVGEPPAGEAGEQTADGAQCRLCKHPAVLTSNGRVRSHLTPEQTPRPCPGGSDFPLGTYPDIVGTTDGLVATLAADCEHVPVGQCYGCHGAAGNPVSDAELEAMAEAQGTGAAPWGVNPDAVTQQTMADQFKASPLAELLERETQGAGTVLDAMDGDTRAEAERFMDAAPATHTGRPPMHSRTTYVGAISPEKNAEYIRILEQRSPERKARMAASMDRTASAALGLSVDPALNHEYTDPSGTKWIHEGPEEACQAPDCAAMRRAYPDGTYCEKCDTDNHRCPGCGTDIPHGAVACAQCTARVDAENDRRQALCSHPDGFQAPLNVDGREVPACGHCAAVAPTSKLPQGETEDGRPCDHADELFGLEDGKPVCVACGAPCTHPDGFAGTADAPGSDDQDRVVSVCEICGTVDPEDVEPVGPDSELPNCPHPGTHRAGCGCPDDDVHDPAEAWRTPADLMTQMPEAVRGLDALRLNCGECGHPVTPLVESFDLYGDPKTVIWVCEPARMTGSLSCDRGGHECEPNTRVRLGELDEGDHFTRRGTLMRVTGETNGVVHAVVVDGPHKGRTGDLPNLGELVDRAPCRHNWITEVPPNGLGHAGPGCEYCGALKTTTEQETKECPDNRTATSPRSSAAASATSSTAAATATSRAPGSPQGAKAPAPAVSPKSKSVTSSAPTATAAGNGRSAVATDQSAAAAAFLGSGRPAAPTTTGPANPADAAAQFLAGGSGAHGEKETKRDRYGRYLIPHPDTGKEKAWTRSTTFAKSISDTYALSQWGLRMALLGATKRPDIVQRAHGKHVRADKKLLDELTAELKTAAGDKVAANLGTSMHSFTEMADRAWHSPGGPRSVLDQVPEDCREMVETYIRLLEETGLEPVPGLIEFTVVVKQYGVAGTSDNCYKVTKPLTLKIGRAEVRLKPGEYVIGDKKTGRDLDYGWQEIAIQLGTYAQGINTSGVWDRHDEVWHPDPLSRFDKPGTKVRTDAGIVVHLPVDKSVDESERKEPAVYGIDLESGWNAAVLCERVRAWRNVRTLASPVMVSEAETFAPARPEPTVTTRTTVRPPTLKDRARSVTSRGDASAVWKDAKTAGLPDAEVDELVSVMQKRLAELEEKAG